MQRVVNVQTAISIGSTYDEVRRSGSKPQCHLIHGTNDPAEVIPLAQSFWTFTTDECRWTRIDEFTGVNLTSMVNKSESLKLGPEKKTGWV